MKAIVRVTREGDGVPLGCPCCGSVVVVANEDAFDHLRKGLARECDVCRAEFQLISYDRTDDGFVDTECRLTRGPERRVWIDIGASRETP